MNIVNKNKKLFTGSISAILIIFIISILHLSGFFNRINLNIIDFITRQSAQPEKAGKNHIAYAIIADSSLKIADSHLDMGWPWRRKYYGKICELTRLCGAKTTVFDFLFSEKSVYRVSSKKPYHEVNDDREFAKNIKKNSNVIIGYRFNSAAPSGKDEKKLKSLMNHIETHHGLLYSNISLSSIDGSTPSKWLIPYSLLVSNSLKRYRLVELPLYFLASMAAVWGRSLFSASMPRVLSSSVFVLK